MCIYELGSNLMMMCLVVRPQYCVLALILSDGFNMTAPYRPRPSCLTCKVGFRGHRFWTFFENS